MHRIHVLANKVQLFLSSRWFFGLIIVVTIAQGAWYALSFVPWVNDESKHFRTTQIYTEQVSPFFTSQPVAWDDAGQVIRGGSYLFYYLYSWPLRGIESITDDTRVQLVVLRFSMILLFIAGLVVYRRALLLIKGFSPGLVNTALAVFVLTPAAGLLAGMYNYDNLAFLLFAAAMYASLRIVSNSQVQARWVGILLILAASITLVKWSSVALIVPLVAAVMSFDIYRHRRSYVRRLLANYRELGRGTQVALVIGLMAGGALVIERPVQNLLAYSGAEPSCEVVLSVERCMRFADYANYKATLHNKPATFQPLPLPAYVIRFWVPYMADKAANLIEDGAKTRLDIVAALYLAGAVAACVVLLLRIRAILARPELVIISIVILVYSAALIWQEYGIYTQYGIPGAIRTRYLVPILPLLFSLVIYVARPWLLRYRAASLAVGLSIGLALLQGGGIITHLFTTPPHAYWTPSIQRANYSLKSALDPVIYDD